MKMKMKESKEDWKRRRLKEDQLKDNWIEGRLKMMNENERRLNWRRCLLFHLCCFDKNQSGMPNNHVSFDHMFQYHNHRIERHLQPLLFHPIPIVDIALHHRRLLFWQNPTGNFYTQCQTSPHHTHHILHCQLRKTNQLDKQCNCCFFLFHESTAYVDTLYNELHQQHRWIHWGCIQRTTFVRTTIETSPCGHCNCPVNNRNKSVCPCLWFLLVVFSTFPAKQLVHKVLPSAALFFTFGILIEPGRTIFANTFTAFKRTNVTSTACCFGIDVQFSRCTFARMETSV